mgnify:FL=1
MNKHNDLKKKHSFLLKSKIFDTTSYVAEQAFHFLTYSVKKLALPATFLGVLWWGEPHLTPHLAPYLASFFTTSSITQPGAQSPETQEKRDGSVSTTAQNIIPPVSPQITILSPDAGVPDGARRTASLAMVGGRTSGAAVQPGRPNTRSLKPNCGSDLLKMDDFPDATKKKIGIKDWNEYTCRMPSTGDVCLTANEYIDRDFAEVNHLSYGCPTGQMCCPPPTAPAPQVPAVEGADTLNKQIVAQLGNKGSSATSLISKNQPPPDAGVLDGPAALPSDRTPPTISFEYDPNPNSRLPFKFIARDDRQLAACTLYYNVDGSASNRNVKDKEVFEQFKTKSMDQTEMLRQLNPKDYCTKAGVGFPCAFTANLLCTDASGNKPSPIFFNNGKAINLDNP